jgi:molybdate transport system substrate-binding protein
MHMVASNPAHSEARARSSFATFATLTRRRLFPLLALALATACGPKAEQATTAPAKTAAPSTPVTVLAAASLTDALTAIGDAYKRETGHDVKFSFASSSTLAKQVEAGAPADVFVSANEKLMGELAGMNLIKPETRVSPIGNDLVIIAPKDSPLTTVTPDASLDLAAILGPDGRIAVGDPEHVPAGQYAKQALTKLGLWEKAEPKLAPAADVRAALALVERGETPIGIVYGTDAAISQGVKVVGRFAEETHDPVSYPFAVLVNAPSPDAQSFLTYATGEKGLAVFDRFGFSRKK